MPKPINISASRGAAILGLSKWRSQVEVWLEMMEEREPGFCEKNNYELPEFEYSAPMRWGHAFESAIVKLAENKMNCKISDREKFFEKGEMTCHIDGRCNLIDLDGTEKPLHEGKTTTIFSYNDEFGEPGTDEVPIDYQIQCQHQMRCTDAGKDILSVLVFPCRVEDWEKMDWEIKKNDHDIYFLTNKNVKDIDGYGQSIIHPIKWAETLDEMGYFHQYEIKPNPELQNLMIKHYTEFWNENIINKKCPIPKSYDDIKKLIRVPKGTVVADENIERLMSEYSQINSEIGQGGKLAKRKDEIKTIVLKWMSEQNAVPDEESTKKWILRSRSGLKLGSYGMNKNGSLIFK